MTDLNPGWRTLRLGDVATNSTIATKDPFGEGFERYIIGKHIHSNSDQITTWNPVGDAEFGSRIRTIFRAGDVICTTRGPKLKVAVPNFDGLSAHTNFILRTKDPAILLQRVLEAVVRSDDFQNHLRKHFRGSTNLFVNWSDAALYEFALPPLEEQERFARLLEAIGQILQTTEAALKPMDEITRRLLEAFDLGAFPSMRVEDLLLEGPKNGVSPVCNGDGKGYPTLSIGCVYSGIVNTGADLKHALIDDELFEKFRLHRNDVLVVRGNGNRELVGRAGIVDEELSTCIYPDLLIRLRFDPAKLHPRLAVHLWNCIPVHGALIRRAKSTNGIYKINGGDIRAHSIPVPPVMRQKQMLEALAIHEAASLSLRERIAFARRMQAAVFAILKEGR